MGSTEKKTNLQEEEEEVQKPQESAPIPTGNPRPRHDSTSSSDSARSPSSDRLKRRRTAPLSASPLSSFFFPAPALPPSLTSPLSPLSLDDVISARNGVTNMALAHEIALDPNFQLEKFEPKQASVEKQVRDVMHVAFWDHLREQLNQDPPVYSQALVLLQEIRDQLLEITLPHQQRLRQEISDKLDVALIKQQAEQGVLDFAQYSSYVVQMMGKLCAPVRDEAIAALARQTDVVNVFCGVAETLDLMKLDMANYTIQMIRPTIVRQIVDYERQKFKEFMKTQQDGLELTRRWIIRNVDKLLSQPPQPATDSTTTSPHSAASPSPTTKPTTTTPSDLPSPNTSSDTTTDKSSTTDTASSSSVPSTSTASPPSPSTPSCPSQLLADPLALRAFVAKVLTSSYMELLTWPDDQLVPEVVAVDTGRVLALRDRLSQLCLLAAFQLVCMSQLAPRLPASCHERARASLKRALCPVLDPAYTSEETRQAVPALVARGVECVSALLKEESGEAAELGEEEERLLKSQLSSLPSPSHRITSLVSTRCLAFISQLLDRAGPGRLSVPQPFLLLQEEVARICKSFLTVTQHNRAVFGEFYFDMVQQRLKEVCEGSQASKESTASGSEERALKEESPVTAQPEEGSGPAKTE